MKHLGCCFGKKEDSECKNRISSSTKLGISLHNNDRKLLKENKLLKFEYTFSSPKKKDDSISVSPFRQRKKENQYNDNFYEEKKLNNFNNTSPIKKMIMKQRFSSMNLKNLERFSLASQNLLDQINHSNKVHWEKKDMFKCLFCGGDACKHEDFRKNKNKHNAINGLHSNFITDEIIAAQRPSTILINNFNLIQVFKEMNIGLIVNVQREGEHPYCGPNGKLEESGFTYNPHHFLAGDVKCKLSGWKDMSVPQSVNFIIDIVKDMSTMIHEKKKKVLVHCHAGYGRTGVVIACYIIYNSSKSLKEIVTEIRKKRSECIQKKDQYAYCEKFADYIHKARILYDLTAHNPEINSLGSNLTKKPIEYFIRNQKDILFGYECEKFEHVPKIIYKILERLIDLKKSYDVDIRHFCKNMSVFEDWNQEQEKVLVLLKKILNKGEYEILEECENISILVTLLFDWLEDEVEFLICPEKVIDIIKDQNFNKQCIYNVENSTNHYIIQKNKENRKELVEFLKSQLLNVEFETILVVAQFFEEISRDQEEDMDLFIDTIDRFCVHLMGYKYIEAYKNKNPRVLERISLQVTSLCTVIRLLIIGIKYDFGDNPYHPGIKNLQVLNKPGISDNSFQTIVANSNTKSFNKPTLQHIQSISNINKPKFSIFSATDNILENLMALDSSFTKKPTLSEIDFNGNATQIVPCNNISEFNAMDCDQQEVFLKKVYLTLGNYFNSQAGSNIGVGNLHITCNQTNNFGMPLLTVNGENVIPLHGNQNIYSNFEKSIFSPIQKTKEDNFTNRQFGYDLNISEICPIPNNQREPNLCASNTNKKSLTENSTNIAINSEKKFKVDKGENNILDYIKNFLEKKTITNKLKNNSKIKKFKKSATRKLSVIYTPHIVIDEGNEDIINESMHKSMRNLGSASSLDKFRNSFDNFKMYNRSSKKIPKFRTVSLKKEDLSDSNLMEPLRKHSINSENVGSFEINSKRIKNSIKEAISNKNVTSKFSKNFEENENNYDQINNKKLDISVSKLSEFYGSLEDNKVFNQINNSEAIHPNLISSGFSDDEIPENNIRTRFAKM